MKMSLQSAVAITHPGNDGETLFVCTPVDPSCSNGYECDALRRMSLLEATKQKWIDALTLSYAAVIQVPVPFSGRSIGVGNL